MLRAAARARIAALDADVLLAHVLGVGREQLYAHPEAPVSADEAARFETLVGRRANGEPVPYLTGEREFHGLTFHVDSRVLVPRPETETLVDHAIEIARRTRARLAVDLGTGSGAIAVSLAVALPHLRLIAIDSSIGALGVAASNALRHGVAERIALRRGDLLQALVRPVDLVCANLPYLPESAEAGWIGERAALRFEPREALLGGPDGLALVRRAVGDLPRVLAPGGAALFEIDPDQAEVVAALLAPLGETRIVSDLAGDARVVIVTRAR